MNQRNSNFEFSFFVLTALFTGSLVIAAVLAAKVVVVGPFIVPAGVLAFSLTFLCTDIIAEVYGKKAAHQTVLAGFIALIATLILIRISLVWPEAPFWKGQEGFESILGTSERIIIASIVAYLISQNADVWVFSKLRRLTNGRFLWLRNNLSTIVSQFLDSVVFVLIAFYGSLPVFEIIIGQWAVKSLIALLDTPFIYAGVWAVTRKQSARNLTDGSVRG